MDAFATVEELEKRWRTLTEAEAERAAVLLADAASVLRAILGNHGIVINPDDELQAMLLEAISCNMVIRVMSIGEDSPTGMTQYSQTAGSYSGVYTFGGAGASGDLYLTAQELKWLGIKRQHIHAVRSAIHDWAGEEIANW